MIRYNAPQNWTFPELETLVMKKKGSIRIGPFGSALKKNEYSNEGIRVLGIEHVLPNNLVWKVPKYIPLKKYAELTQYTVKENDILVTNMGTVGRTCVFPKGFGKSIISSHLIKVTIDSKVCDPKYLSWMLNFCPIVIAQIKAKCHGAIMAGFNTALLKSLKIPLPPLDIQKKIATVLDKADQLQQKRKQAIEKLEQLVQSVFLDMFGDPVKNPNGWKKKPLKNCCIGKTKNGYFAKNDQYSNDGTPIVWISNFINKFYVNTENLKKVNCSQMDIEKNSIQYGDVLFCRSSLNFEGIGKAAIVPQNIQTDTIFECHIIKCRLNQNIIIPEFLRSLTDTIFFRNQIIKYSKTATMTTISQDGILETEVIIPPLDKQREYTTKLSSIFKEKYYMIKETECLDNLLNSLLQRAFKGDLKFNDKAFKELEQTMT